MNEVIYFGTLDDESKQEVLRLNDLIGEDRSYIIEEVSGSVPLKQAPWLAGEGDMKTTTTGNTLTGKVVVVKEAILVGLRNTEVFVVEHVDGTVDITGHGLGFRPLTDEVFDRVVRRQEFRDITYINKDGLVVEFHTVDGVIHIKKIPLCVKSKVVNKHNKPRIKVKIQGVSQNLAPFIDAGFGVNNLMDLSIFDPTTLQTHHINGVQSDDRPENLITLPSFVHYKLHKNSINRDKELLYDEEAYIGRCLSQVAKERRDEVLLNLKEFELFCSGLGLTYSHREKLHKARHMMVKAFDTTDDNHLEVVYDEEFAKKVLNLQYEYYKGKKLVEALEDVIEVTR